MASVIVMQDLNQLKLAISRVPEANNTAIQNIVQTDGKALYNDINNNTRVRTGRLKRGNIMELTATGFHYYNNVPYAKHMDTGPRGNQYVTNAFNKFKPNVVRRVNEEVGKSITLLFKSIGK